MALALAVIVWLLVRTPAHGAEAQTVTLPGYAVGEFREPAVTILRAIDGRRVLSLRSLVPGLPPIEAPVEALRLVQTKAVRTKIGSCCGSHALAVGRKQPRNSLFYRRPRIACAAYTAYIGRHCGRAGLSYSASAQYAQLRRRGGQLVAAKMSTRYIPYLRYLKSGDFIYFHKGGGRIGHTEIYVGNGLVSGTSSSAGRVGIRRLGNRGFALCSVIRL